MFGLSPVHLYFMWRVDIFTGCLRTAGTQSSFFIPPFDLEKEMAPHSSTLAGKSHGQMSLVGCSLWVPWAPQLEL